MVSLRGARTRLKGVLTPRQEERGYRAFETEDFVEVYHLHERIAVFSAYGAKPRTIKEAADRHWAKR